MWERPGACVCACTRPAISWEMAFSTPGWPCNHIKSPTSGRGHVEISRSFCWISSMRTAGLSRGAATGGEHCVVESRKADRATAGMALTSRSVAWLCHLLQKIQHGSIKASLLSSVRHQERTCEQGQVLPARRCAQRCLRNGPCLQRSSLKP